MTIQAALYGEARPIQNLPDITAPHDGARRSSTASIISFAKLENLTGLVTWFDWIVVAHSA
jgi:hypothetical protein